VVVVVVMVVVVVVVVMVVVVVVGKQKIPLCLPEHPPRALCLALTPPPAPLLQADIIR
jgi:hypothetical protein